MTGIQLSKNYDLASPYKIVLIIFGIISLILAFALFIGGGALFFVTNEFVDDDGFLNSNSILFESDSHAVVFQPINIDVGNFGSYMWHHSIGDFVTIKLSGSNNDQSKNIFIGIGKTSDVNNYLNGVAYSEVKNLNMFPTDVTYASHSGIELPEDPTTQTSFLVSVHGPGTQTLEWVPDAGSYSVILMNDDGSSNVDLNIKIMAKVPLLNTIMMMLFFGGIIALIFGCLLIYFARGLSNQSRQEVVASSRFSSNKSGTVFCSKCGSKIDEEDGFCQNCGQKQK